MKHSNLICTKCGNEITGNQIKRNAIKSNIFLLVFLLFMFVGPRFAPHYLSHKTVGFLKFILASGYIGTLLVLFQCPKCLKFGSKIPTDSPMGRKLKAELAPYQNDDASITKTLTHS